MLQMLGQCVGGAGVPIYAVKALWFRGLWLTKMQARRAGSDVALSSNLLVYGNPRR